MPHLIDPFDLATIILLNFTTKICNFVLVDIHKNVTKNKGTGRALYLDFLYCTTKVVKFTEAAVLCHVQSHPSATETFCQST